MKKIKENPYWFSITLTLNPGIYQYKFLVDGQWKFDPNEKFIKNAFGNYDNEIQILPAIAQIEPEIGITNNFTDFTFGGDGLIIPLRSDFIADYIAVKGNWDNWQSETKMEKVYSMVKNGYESLVYLKLWPGIYQFKFLVDGSYQYDSSKMRIPDGFGNFNNQIFVKPNVGIQIIKKKRSFNPDNLVWSSIEREEFNFSNIEGHTMSIIGNEIYIFGGFYHHKFMDTLYLISDAEVNLLNTKGRIPEGRAYHSQAVFGNKIIIYGGLNEWKVFNDYHIYNTISKTWSKVATENAPFAREKCTLTLVLDRYLILFGGYFCSPDLDEHNYNDSFSLDLISMNWTELDLKGNLPEPRAGHSAICYKNGLYIFGGVQRTNSSPEKIFNDLVKANLDENIWENIETKGLAPVPRRGHVGIIVNCYMLIHGGKDLENNLFDDLFLLDLEKLVWVCVETRGRRPGARCFHSAVNLNNEILFFGGYKKGIAKRKPILYKLACREEGDEDSPKK